MFRKTATLAIVGLTVSSFTLGHAQTSPEFVPGYGALDVFDGAGIATTPLWVKIWFAVMITTFAAGLIFVWRHMVARLTVGGFVLPFLVAGPIFNALGLPFLGGSIAIAHLVFWTPALAVLILHRPFLDSEMSSGFRTWSAAMTGVILFSFVFDIRDTVTYISYFAG